MLEIFLKTLPFFALIGLGYWAGRTRFFPEEATGYLTKFVFYFALTAMLFRFAATLPVTEMFDAQCASAYLLGCVAVYLLVTLVAKMRGLSVAEAAIEAQCGIIGNTGFLGVPMLVALLGAAAIGPVMMVLSIDLIVFSSLIVILITGSRDGRMSFGVLTTVGKGLLKNPMVMSMAVGLLWSVTKLPIPAPANEFLTILGDAATPGALFAIGASLAYKTAERMSVAIWLSFAKLVLHPLAVGVCALLIFDVARFDAGVMIAAASLPVAGNVYILAQHYGVAPHRVSASILVSTLVSIFTVSVVIAWVVTL
ncbi:MAG: AEC family transporter [Marinosulfonomonas sp.]|nr:AEC family transporter [Marinosulfonomonas sp.]